MIIITGQPRCGTSMMCHCLFLAGVPKAYREQGGKRADFYRNPSGCYEGRWNGQNGFMKNFSPVIAQIINRTEKLFKTKKPFTTELQKQHPEDTYIVYHVGEDELHILTEEDKKELRNIRFIYMTREPSKIAKSWEDIHKNIPQSQLDKSKQEAYIKQRFEQVDRWVIKHPHIKVDYDTFVTDPEHYREVFTTLFPELDYDLIISGIDRYLYINR